MALKRASYFGFLLLIACPATAADDVMSVLTTGYCTKCHGRDDPQGELRLERVPPSFYEDAERLERLIGVLSMKQMPPPEQQQPAEALRNEAVQFLKSKLQARGRSGNLKRLTREEYTHSVNDLFDTQFNLSELLPADPPGDGFNKWGDAQRMSPFQVESYLHTARFIADRLLLDQRPLQHEWEFGLGQFNGSGRGDFKSETAFVLSTHYPWRSNLHFYLTDRQEEIFRIPEFGHYRFEADVTVRNSHKAQTISVSTGDPRYPTNFKKVARVVLPVDGKSISVDLTLTAGTYVSFTYESAATWNVGSKPEEYTGPQVAFSKVRIMGPITESWPTASERRILDEARFTILTAEDVPEFTEHVISLVLNRSLPASDVALLEQLVAQKLEANGSPKAAARTLLTALLSSPHFIYKYEPETLDEIAFAYRLSYFLWNSVPDASLLAVARAGELREETLSAQVERLLADPRSDRFCEDFTRQWLQTDKVDDIGPDDRVHDKKKVTFMKIRELAKEPRAFFREILQHDLSMINFIDSNFVMANDETAEFYDYGGVNGRAFQRVPLPDGSERGGLLGQAGLLKLTSGKFSTSPIRRGAWVLESIYGQTLNPPPDVTFEEPDLRGAVTLKETIEQHKRSTTCNRCHARIDPFGLALEHYDEMGRWRDEYRYVETLSLENGGKSVKKRTGPIDSMATLPDGRQIGSLTDLKGVLMEDREQVLKGILAKLASYALAREVSVRDEATIDELYRHIGERNYSLRAAVHAIVRHESFRDR